MDRSARTVSGRLPMPGNAIDFAIACGIMNRSQMERQGMKLPAITSRLLALQEAANAELRLRLGEVFKRYRGLAFAARSDKLFAEHWTPEVAASGYTFAGFEVRGDEIVLHGMEDAGGFIYRISIAFPLHLIDDPAAIDSYFQRQWSEVRKGAMVPATPQADPGNPPAN